MRFAKLCACFLVALLICSSLLYAQDGKTLFEAKCAMCHGKDAAGKTPMGQRLQIKDLRAPEIQKESDATLTQTITKGKGKMPAFEGKLTKEQMAQVVTYIRELGKK